VTTGLVVQGLSVRYGGVAAVSNVSLDVQPGEIVGLIGPNGAGKTSLIDAICGYAPCTGSVALDNEMLTGHPPQQRIASGIGRTWQTADLFEDLSVLENLGVSAERHSWAILLAQVFWRQDDTRVTERSIAVLSLFGIADLRNAMPSALSQGQRKLVDVARAVVAQPRVICLDEPAAGLDSAESLLLGSQLRRLANNGMGLLLVDHDMDLVLGICDRIVVLDFGQRIANGTPDQIRTDQRVITAYLGSEESDYPSAARTHGAGP
jgi:branched-chain amino acid transport system ATP-binding protein